MKLPRVAVAAMLALFSVALLTAYWHLRRERARQLNVNTSAGVRRLSVTLSFSGRVRVAVKPLDLPQTHVPSTVEKEKTVEVECDGLCSVEVEVVGGRGYTVLVSWEGGEKSFTVPYVREFDDLASKLVEEGVVVSAAYMPWSMGEVLGASWRRDVPLLGLYDALDDYIQWKHVDWARGHGIHLFWVDWTMYASSKAGDRIFKVTQKLLEKEMVVGVMLGPQVDMHWGPGYPSIDLSDDWNAGIFLNLVQRALTLMKDPNYYRVGERPAILIWNEAAFYNRESVYKRMREMVVRELGVEPYVITDVLPRVGKGGVLTPGTPEGRWYVDNVLLRRGDGGDKYIDAYTSWIGFYTVQGSGALTSGEMELFPETYKRHLDSWRLFARARGKCVVPTVSPGFDRTHDPVFGQPEPIPRDVGRFKAMLEASLANVGECGEVRVDTWNDFYEGTYVEPSLNEGLLYLEAIRDVARRLNGS
ncbi:MAG: glycoside hydrolase family 99-like domain-containing protein [Thermofilaceae archaeon]|nr:glycoside hydrolase family 99-like domain-containing protein [Thermofilaceae archaeon]MDW8004257.1 glycoside hydrolase family 99-like domain-containing protein [Thermofilaceae archaeon]